MNGPDQALSCRPASCRPAFSLISTPACLFCLFAIRWQHSRTQPSTAELNSRATHLCAVSIPPDSGDSLN